MRTSFIHKQILVTITHCRVFYILICFFANNTCASSEDIVIQKDKELGIYWGYGIIYGLGNTGSGKIRTMRQLAESIGLNKNKITEKSSCLVRISVKKQKLNKMDQVKAVVSPFLQNQVDKNFSLENGILYPAVLRDDTDSLLVIGGKLNPLSFFTDTNLSENTFLFRVLDTKKSFQKHKYELFYKGYNFNNNNSNKDLMNLTEQEKKRIDYFSKMGHGKNNNKCILGLPHNASNCSVYFGLGLVYDLDRKVESFSSDNALKVKSKLSVLLGVPAGKNDISVINARTCSAFLSENPDEISLILSAKKPISFSKGTINVILNSMDGSSLELFGVELERIEGNLSSNIFKDDAFFRVVRSD